MGSDGAQDAQAATRTLAFGPLTGAERRRLGRLGGALYLAGTAFSFPASLALDPLPAATSQLLPAAGMLVALAALVAPWDRMSALWLHAVIVGATLQVALSVAILSNVFSFYYVLIAIYAAYIVRDRRVLAAYFVLLTIALVAPLVHDPENTREQAHQILVTLPVFLISAGLVLYLRDTVETRERRYRRFAYEAVTLAIRIRGSGRHSHADERADELDATLDELAAQAEGEMERDRVSDG